MNSELTSKNILAIQFVEEHYNKILTLTEPLIRFLKIDSFGYFKMYKNNRYLYFFNNIDFIKHYLSTVPHNGSFFNNESNKAVSNDFYSFAWSDINSTNDVVTDALKVYSINNGISIYRRCDEFIESWHFADTQYRIPIDFYYQANKQLFFRYIDYFNTCAKKMIYSNDVDERHAFYSNQTNTNYKPENFIEAHSIAFLKYITINPNFFNQIQFTAREIECINYLSVGFSAKMIGKNLNLSHRTIEAYFHNIRNKTGLKKNIDIINFCKEKILI